MKIKRIASAGIALSLVPLIVAGAVARCLVLGLVVGWTIAESFIDEM